MTKTIRSRALLGAAVAALAPAGLLTATSVITPAAAQDYTSGAIAGTVVDGSGNPVSGASVSVSSQAQGFTRSATTTSAGGFRLSGLPAGSYDVSISSSAGSTSEEGVRVAASSTSNYTFVVGAATGDEVVVTGTRKNLDFANTTTGVNLDVEDLVREIPIGRDLTSLTLLAPGTTQGDDGFGNLASLGGASVAENAYYLNGLNITDFNNYLGSSLVPFEFYKSVEVKTGGYSAEFGRATGGVINAVTKSGSNEFDAKLHVNWEPDALRSDSPDTYSQRNALDSGRSFDMIAEVSGPIIEDRLFVYGIVELNDNVDRDSGILSGNTIVDTQKSPFFGFKVDAYPIDNHHLEFTYFDSDRKTTRTTFDFDTATDTSATNPNGLSEYRFGGESFVGKYTGVLTDWLTISAAYGKNNDRNELIPLFGDAAKPYVVDLSLGGVVCGFGSLCNGQTTTVEDFPQYTQREFWRADADMFFNFMGDHHVRIGFDREENLLVHDGTRTGGGEFPRAYIYRNCGGSARCQGTPALGPNDNYVEINHYKTGGVFDSKNIAYYFQDEWNVTDRLTLNLGVRLDQFNNFTADGSQFVDFNNLWAPRAGFSYDVFGDGRGRLYGNFGVYFLPVAGNTAYRQGAQEYYFREYWTFTGADGDGIPVLGDQMLNWAGGNTCPYNLEPTSTGAGTSSCNVTGDGSVQDPTSSISRNLRATREREIIIGYEHQLNDLWTVGVNYTRRNLRTNAEDVAIDAAVIDFCNDPANGVDQSTTACSSIWTGYHQYTIINPGFDSTIVLNELLPGETEQRTVAFTADQLGYPKAERTYDAVEVTFAREFDGKWNLNGSYSWSQAKGNSEGYVQSDFEQDDAGITQDFDQPEFTDFAYGKLPNHRTHRIKLWGSYAVLENLTVGSQVQISSPRPLSCIGYHPLDQFGAGDFVNLANGYGAASRYCGGQPSPRGTAQETDWLYNMNASVRYNIEIPSGQTLTLRADVFNLFNLDAVQGRNETGENAEPLDGLGNTVDWTADGVCDASEQAAINCNPYYGRATSFQQPRYVRLGVDIDF